MRGYSPLPGPLSLNKGLKWEGDGIGSTTIVGFPDDASYPGRTRQSNRILVGGRWEGPEGHRESSADV